MLVVLLLILLAVIVTEWVVIWKHGNVSTLFWMVVAFHIFLWYFLPALLSVSLEFIDERYLIMPIDEYLEYANLNFAFIAITILPFCFTRMEFKSVLRFRFPFYTKPGKLMLLGTSFMVLVLFVIRYVPPFSEFDQLTYFERNSIEDMGQPINISSNAVIVFIAVSIVGKSWVYALLLANRFGIKNPLWFNALLWSWVIFDTIKNVLSGARIAMALPLMLAFLIFLPYFRKYSLRIMLIFPPLAVCVLLLLPVSISVSRLRVTSSVYSLSDLYNESSFKMYDVQGMMEDLATKFNSIEYGTVLVKKDGYAKGGFQCYKGGFLSLVPRAILPNKPIPGSTDGTWSGHYSRVTAYAMGGDSSVSNVGVSPLMITLWQVGYVGVPFLIIANIFFLMLTNTLFKMRSMAMNAIGLYIVSLPTVAWLFAPIDQILVMGQRALVLMVAIALLTWLWARFSPLKGVSSGL